MGYIIRATFVATSVTQNIILDENIRDEETNTSTENLASQDEDFTHLHNSSISLNIKIYLSDHRNQNLDNQKKVELTKERQLVVQDVKTSIPKKKEKKGKYEKSDTESQMQGNKNMVDKDQSLT